MTVGLMAKKATKAQRRFIARNYRRMNEAELAKRLGLDVPAVHAAVAEIEKRPASRPKVRPEPSLRTAPIRRSPRAAALCILAIVVVSLLSYLNSFKAELIYDNHFIINRNRYVTNPDYAPEIWTTHYWAGRGNASNLYRPMTIFSYYVNYVVLGGESEPAGYHVVNLLLHVACGVLVYSFVFRLVRNAGVSSSPKQGGSGAGLLRHRLVALFAALLFAAHPAQTEAVTNVVGRADLLAMMFTLAALLLHMKGSEAGREKRMRYFVSAAFFLLLGLLSKENAIVMIALAFALDVMFVRPLHRREKTGRAGFLEWFRPHAVRSYSLYIAVIAGWFVVRALVLPEGVLGVEFDEDNPLRAAAFIPREFTAVAVLGLYLRRLVFPLTLSADYSYNQIPLVNSALDGGFLGALGAIIALGVIAVLFWKKSRIVTYLILFFFIAIAPVSNVFVLSGTIAAERLLYMPSLAWCALISMGGFALFGRAFGGRKIPQVVLPCVLLGVVVGLYGVRTYVRNEDWRDNQSFWGATFETSPNSVKTLCNYGTMLHKKKDFDGAIGAFKKSIAIAPEHLKAYGPLGDALIQKGKDARDASERNSCYREAHEYMTRGLEQVDEERRRARELTGCDNPSRYWEIYFLLASSLRRVAVIAVEEGRLDDADRQLEDAAGYYRLGIPAKLEKGVGHAGLADALLDRVDVIDKLHKMDGQDRDRLLKLRRELLDEAAVSAVRSAIVHPEYPGSWKSVFRCSGCLENDLRIAVFRDERGRYRLDARTGGNAVWLARAFRSLIMISLAGGRGGKAMEYVDEAARNYALDRNDLLSLLKQRFSIDDPSVWLGGKTE